MSLTSKVLGIDVDAPEPFVSPIDLKLPDWIMYVAIFARVLVDALTAVFLKKSK